MFHETIMLLLYSLGSMGAMFLDARKLTNGQLSPLGTAGSYGKFEGCKATAEFEPLSARVQHCPALCS